MHCKKLFKKCQNSLTTILSTAISAPESFQEAVCPRHKTTVKNLVLQSGKPLLLETMQAVTFDKNKHKKKTLFSEGPYVKQNIFQ